MDLDAYRARAERFLEEHDREYLEHFAGRKRAYEVDAVYDRHAGLFGLDAIDALRDAHGRAGGGEEARRLRWLLAFAVEGRLGLATRALDARVARREAELTLAVDGRVLPLRTAALEQMNEPDGALRGAIEDARLALEASELEPLRREAWETAHAEIRTLGWPSYAVAWGQLSGVDLQALAGQAEAFLIATEDEHAGALDAELRRTTGRARSEARRSDLQRWLRDVDADPRFPPEGLLGAWRATCEGLGLASDGIVLDLEPRPTKSPRAFCAPVRVPEEVHLVVPPTGGRDDYLALFHEGGHAEHYAAVDSGAAVEDRRLGDNAITEAFAFLLEDLVEREEASARARRRFYLRRYAAKLLYELDLHDGDGLLSARAPRYARRLSEATGVVWPRETYLEDVDPAFYVACYLRAWALEARLREALSERFGDEWPTSAAAGAWLRALWRRGQAPDPDELADGLDGGGPLRLDVALVG
jgi:hypothetical protein